MPKLFFASLVTLSLLAAMLAGVIIAAMVAMGTVELPAALLLTLVANAIIFFISPWLTDLMLRWFNGLRWLEDAEVRSRYPHVHRLLQDVARKHRFTPPRIGFIDDRNPTAFTYGRLQSNARIVVTAGIFEFLNEDEQKAVVAHELGHIVHRDFLVMTVAGMLVQMMFQVYAAMRRLGERGSGKKDKSASFYVTVAVVSYLCYLLGTYILLYLSRTREYLADRFSAEWVEPRHLASALVKVAYGLSQTGDEKRSSDLLAATRHLGIVDVKSARHIGLVAGETEVHPEAAAEAMLFDIYNPWARLIELGSTHPLTGHRIQKLSEVASEKRQSFDEYDVAAAARRKKVDAGALWRQFTHEVVLVALPAIVGAGFFLFGLLTSAPEIIAFAVPAALLTWVATIPTRYPFTPPQNASVAELMGDCAASPIVGRPVRLEGQVIGRAVAGSIVGEDTVFRDTSGRIVIDFRSMLAGIGDLWAGYMRVKPHIGSSGEVTGWFRRGACGVVVMSRLETKAGTIVARPYLREIVSALLLPTLLAVIGLMIYAAQ